MRAYFFNNMYLASIQQGIQPQHVTSSLFVKYRGESQITDQLYDWADNHITSIMLNAGYSSALREIIAFFDNTENPYPWTYFVEDEDAIGPLVPTVDGHGGALTSVGIILPAKIYETAAAMKADPQVIEEISKFGVYPGDEGNLEFSKWEFELCQELTKYGLAS